MKHELTAKRLSKALANVNKIPQELANESGVSKSSISQYLNGSHKPSNISSGKMAKVLDVNPLWLMGFDVPMKKIDKHATNEHIDELARFKANTYEALVIKEMRKMNKAGKVKLLDTARDMTCNPLYNPDYQIEIKAAHERTDIEVTDEMRKHDDDIMNDDDF